VRRQAGHGGSPARSCALATKIQRQPFAPFQLVLSVHPIAGGPPDGAFSHFGI